MNGISAPIRRDTKEMNFPQLEATEEGGSLKTRKEPNQTPSPPASWSQTPQTPQSPEW